MIAPTTFPIDALRAAFPSLAAVDEGVPRTYLDNPAGTQVPQRVGDAAARTLLHGNANLGGYFRTSTQAEAEVVRAHEAMARFLGARSYREIVIGPSMTSLTFSLSRSIGRTLRAGDEIVVTHMDHDGNIAPWLALAEERDLRVVWVDFDHDTWQIEPAALERALTERTRLVALNHASNLTGSVNDVRRLIDLAHAAGALVYLDSVQYAPHFAIDVAELDCDFLACSSYKFFGPHLGIVWGREPLLENLYAYKVRPQTSDLPWKFETGTPQIEQLAALAETIDYFEWAGGHFAAASSGRARILAAFDATARWERDLAVRTVQGLRDIAGIDIVGIADSKRFDRRVPTISFVHAKHAPDDIARRLAAQNIFAWSGHNFALEVVRSLGIDEDRGVVRVGFAHYNTPAEAERLLEAVAAL
jgi:cysteine desulfurase family protein (TIGR01976 family)